MTISHETPESPRNRRSRRKGTKVPETAESRRNHRYPLIATTFSPARRLYGLQGDDRRFCFSWLAHLRAGFCHVTSSPNAPSWPCWGGASPFPHGALQPATGGNGRRARRIRLQRRGGGEGVRDQLSHDSALAEEGGRRSGTCRGDSEGEVQAAQGGPRLGPRGSENAPQADSATGRVGRESGPRAHQGHRQSHRDAGRSRDGAEVAERR